MHGGGGEREEFGARLHWFGFARPTEELVHKDLIDLQCTSNLGNRFEGSITDPYIARYGLAALFTINFREDNVDLGFFELRDVNIEIGLAFDFTSSCVFFWFTSSFVTFWMFILFISQETEIYLVVLNVNNHFQRLIK